MPVQPLRKRYLAVRVEGDGAFSREDVEMLVQTLVSEGLMDPALLRVIWYTTDTGLGIIRCSHKCVDEVKLALSAVTEVSGRRATVKTLGVSGTVRALRRKFLPKGSAGD